MKWKFFLIIVISIFLAALNGCKTSPNGTNSNFKPGSVAGPLPDGGFKAEISLAQPLTKLRVGQIEIITIKVKNASNTVWWQRGGETTDRTDNMFYIAAGNRWLDKDGKSTTETEGHNGIPKNLMPGEETEMPLQITAPQKPGEWIMSLDMVQEGVAWFGDKGSPTTKIKVTVVN